VVAWSHDLLHADDKTLLHQLAVFRGGAALSAVAATAERGQLDAVRVAQLLGALVDKLDTVREYALERLAEAGSLGAAQLGHADYFATVADAARTELRGLDWLACSRRLELEHDNLWAALAYARNAPRPGDRGPAGRGAGLVLRARRAGIRGAQLPRSCACVGVGRRAGRQADRAAGVAVLSGDRGAGSRRRDRHG
jgi:predicted ATPase